MFSSLASFIFGSNTSATTNSEENNQPIGERQEQGVNETNLLRIEAENTINVTSSTPSVSGSSTSPTSSSVVENTNSVRQQQQQAGKRNNPNNNNKGNNSNNNKRNNNNKQNRNRRHTQKVTPVSITKLLTPNESSGEDLDEDDWFIVEKEDEADSLPRTDSEEELSVVEIKNNNSLVASTATTTSTHQPALTSQQQQQRRRQQHINSHSLYSGPRPQQQRNLLQRARNNGAARSAVALNVSPTLSPPLNAAAAAGNAGINANASASAAASADTAECISQSLYVMATPAITLANGSNGSGIEFGTNIAMEESWFVTPPPCFTSIGPIHMETSPYENLLIEHPSMSVYHSIRSAQEAAESFVNLDLGMGDNSRPRHRPVVAAAVSVAVTADAKQVAVRNTQPSAPQQPRTTSARADRFTAAQIKQEMFARSTQKSHDKKERQNLCRGAIKRSNKARDVQSRGNRQRRADMQHCKLLSGVNNNRKCCF